MDYNLEFGDYKFMVLPGKDDSMEVHLNITMVAEIEKWIQMFQYVNNISFNSKYTHKPSKYFEFHKVFMCTHGNKRHKSVRKTYTSCPVTFNVKLRTISESLLTRNPERNTYRTTVTIKGIHNHDLNSVETLKELRINPATKEAFYRYFLANMDPRAALAFHTEKMSKTLKEKANRSVYPSINCIYHWYTTWKRKQAEQEDHYYNTPEQFLEISLGEEDSKSTELLTSLVENQASAENESPIPVLGGASSSHEIEDSIVQSDEALNETAESRNISNIIDELADNLNRLSDSTSRKALLLLTKQVSLCKTTNSLNTLLLTMTGIKKRRVKGKNMCRSTLVSRMKADPLKMTKKVKQPNKFVENMHLN